MKKLALLFCGISSLIALNLYAEAPVSSQQQPQYQEVCQPAPCYNDTVCNQLPCNVPVGATNCTNVPCLTPAAGNSATNVPCAPAPCYNDTVCAPAPCVTPAPAPAQTTAQVNNACC
ncbi:MAG: hypothetical protein J1F38_04705 [Muribaculaceae bacterium]|nr:hypothetical protein [Muribaculaceae bacterium]